MAPLQSPYLQEHLVLLSEEPRAGIGSAQRVQWGQRGEGMVVGQPGF